MEEKEIVTDIDQTIEQTNQKIKQEKKQNKVETKSDNSYRYIVWAVILILVIIVVVSLIKSVNTNPIKTKDYTYNGFTFAKNQDGHWVTRVQLGNQAYQMLFYNHPTEVEDSLVDKRIKYRITELNSSSHLFLAVDENMPLDNGAPGLATIAAVQISRLYKFGFIKVPTNGVMYNENLTRKEFLNSTIIKRINCDVTSPNMVVMRFTLGNESIMKFNETKNCITVTAKDPEDFVKLTERLNYELLGIIKE